MRLDAGSQAAGEIKLARERARDLEVRQSTQSAIDIAFLQQDRFFINRAGTYVCL
jgi:hypothetical protein